MVPGERDAMLAADDGHWWYRGRRQVIRAELERMAPGWGLRMLDAGCGSGRMLPELERFGHATGVDADPACVRTATERGHAVRLGSIAHLPFPSARFDLITCLDVIEHLPDDVAALTELRRVTAPGGRLLVTVPAFQSLWSSHDVANEHLRRYRAPQLRSAATAADWTTERVTYFNSLLFAPAALVRIAGRLRRRPRPAGRSDLDLTPARLDPLLELPMRAEAALLRRGLRLPAGLSLLAILANDDQSSEITVRSFQKATRSLIGSTPGSGSG
jgi:SAM-dependent methyltransferase